MAKFEGKALKNVAKNIAINIIDQKTKFDGSIECGGDIRIDGQFKGTLIVKGVLVLGKTGVIDGTVTTQNAYIYGVFTGDLKVEENLLIGEKGRVQGDLVAKNLEINKGAEIQAKIETNYKKPNQETKKKNLVLNK
ncbi:MAG: polymer-forming cytoskeletal protein [Flavobacteriaceae bacterium]|nr:polymer-forming cytoskeletal protein [Flavobacteriaceae bacterium]MCY4266412.1 polymer-forming cytoskeletal protein [Flavobacteriaceae bacterium]